MATHSSTLGWRIPWTEEPGRLYSPWGCKSQTWLRDLSITKEGLIVIFKISNLNLLLSLFSDWLLNSCFFLLLLLFSFIVSFAVCFNTILFHLLCIYYMFSFRFPGSYIKRLIFIMACLKMKVAYLQLHIKTTPLLFRTLHLCYFTSFIFCINYCSYYYF